MANDLGNPLGGAGLFNLMNLDLRVFFDKDLNAKFVLCDCYCFLPFFCYIKLIEMILKLSFKDEGNTFQCTNLPIYIVCERNLTSKLNAVPNQPRNDVLSAAEDLSQAQCRQKTQGLSASRHLQYTKFRLQR